MTLKNTDKIKTSLKSFVLQTQAKCVWRATGEFIKFLHKDINRWQTFRQIGRFRRTNSTTRFSKNLSTKKTIFCQRHLRSKLRIVTPQIYYYRLGNLNLSMLFVMVYGQFLWELRHIVSLFFFSCFILRKYSFHSDPWREVWFFCRCECFDICVWYYFITPMALFMHPFIFLYRLKWGGQNKEKYLHINNRHANWLLSMKCGGHYKFYENY